MATPQALVLIQRLLAVPFIVLGGWCLAAPGMVEALTFQPAYQHLSATSALLTRFTRWTYLGYGLALLPFFFFNYYFLFVVPALNRWMALDFVANLFMLVLCAVGYRLSRSAPSQDTPT